MASNQKNILKKNNLANRKMTRADYLGMEMNQLKNLVGSFSLGRRGRPSKKDYIDVLMVRQAIDNETKPTAIRTNRKKSCISRRRRPTVIPHESSLKRGNRLMVNDDTL